MRFVNAQFVDDGCQETYRKDNGCESCNKLQCASHSETFAVWQNILGLAYTRGRDKFGTTHI